MLSTSAAIRRLLVIAALLVGPTILIGPALLPGRALLPADLLLHFEPWRSQVAAAPYAHWDPLVWDGIAQYYPWRHFAAESLREGLIPLWNPYQFCGTPFLANGQSAVLYPLNLIFWLLPVARAFGWSAWLHLALTGWFAYLFLRKIGTGRFGALAGAVVWQANSFLIAWLHLPTVLCTATWLPLVLLFCERALMSDRARYAVGAGVALSLSYLGGHPQIFLFVALLSAAYLIARGLSHGTPVGRAGLRLRAVRLLTTGAVTGAVGLGLASVQLLPTLDLLRIAHRAFVPGSDSYTFFLGNALPVSQLAGLLIPHAFGHPALGTYIGRGNYAEYALYVGIVALALAVWAVFASRKWHTRFFAVTALLTTAIALGTAMNWPLYWWLPGMARAGGPNRILLLLIFSLSVLTGIGVDALFRRLALAGKSAIIAPSLVLISVAFCSWLCGRLVIGTVAALNPAAKPLAAVELARGILLIAGTVLCMHVVRTAPLRRLGQSALIAILAADLLLAARHHVHITPVEWVYPKTAIAAPVQGRVLSNAADWPIDRFPSAVLPPNAATVYHLRDAFGYDSLYLAHYRDFAAAIQHGDPSPPLNGNLLLARLGPIYGLDMLSLAGVDTVLSPVPVRGLTAERSGAFYTYHNPHARPRAWVAESALFVPTHHEALAALLRLGPQHDCLIITGPDQPADELPSRITPTATVRDLSPNTVTVDLPQGGGGYLFLADSCAPGWRAYADGQELPVRAADVTFRAVAPPREAKSVLFRYEPASFRVGLFISLLALCVGCVVTAGMLAARGASR